MEPYDQVLPRYGDAALSDILPTIAARWGLGCGRDGIASIPKADTYIVWLVDGLGWSLIHQYAKIAPYLAGLASEDAWITAGTPSTTCTSLTSFGTGLPPGAHGVAGYRFFLPDIDSVFGPLQWDCYLPPEAVQPEATMFERIASQGPLVTTIAPSRFQGSGLTELALRGGTFIGLETESDDERRLDEVVRAAAAGPGLVYVYLRELDHEGHKNGISSEQWRTQLARADKLVADTRKAVPDDVRILVTGDHGMIDIPQDRRLSLEQIPGLRSALTQVAGEGRFRHLYTRDPRGVKALCRDVLGDRAWVLTRDEAIAQGWFGPVAGHHAGRFGDVMIAMRDDWALMLGSMPGEWDLVGMHGSLTAAEQLVPLLVD